MRLGLRGSGVLVAGLFAVAGCHRSDGPAPHREVAPETQAELPTTDGAIALGNLTAQIHGLETVLARTPRDVEARGQLLALTATRARYTGRVDDLGRGLSLAEEMVRDAPDQADPYLARAGAQATLHRFDAALGDLAEAARRGATPPRLQEARASILQAKGDLTGALALRRAAREAHADLGTLGAEAALLGELGRTDEAETRFRQAAKSYRDVSPFPVAWLFLQEGLMWERAGDAGRSRVFYAEARARLPAYAHAVSHLARLEPPARAVEMLAPVVAASDDPEFELALAEALRRRGDAAPAEKHFAHVEVRYDGLCAEYPEAFAEHAGFFWLDRGNAPERALALAQQNLAVRHTAKAYELGLLAATAAGKPAEACALGAGVAEVPNAPEMLRALAAEACGKR
jgi:tetratricopeptide (TPR) repeat protein